MADKAAVRDEASRLMSLFRAAGAARVEAPVLLPADLLLDLYGEDIRGRAFTTSDPLRGEMMLRPDFTVPVVRMHMQGGAAPARYAYTGEVFRRQEGAADRPSEYVQVGYELFDGADPAASDAEVFALFARVLAPFGARVATGDIGILTAAVSGITGSEQRKRALMRHIWRPRRFRELLDRFGGTQPVPPARAALLAAAAPLNPAAPAIGLRTEEEVLERIARLRAEASEPAVPASELRLLDDILAMDGGAATALVALRGLAGDMPALTGAVDRFAARLDALASAGVDVEALAFEASFGRTSMEYYDGFVFGFMAPDRPDLPPMATGGRYDALTRVLGQGQEIPAVGGVVRPDVLLAAGGVG